MLTLTTFWLGLGVSAGQRAFPVGNLDVVTSFKSIREFNSVDLVRSWLLAWSQGNVTWSYLVYCYRCHPFCSDCMRRMPRVVLRGFPSFLREWKSSTGFCSFKNWKISLHGHKAEFKSKWCLCKDRTFTAVPLQAYWFLMFFLHTNGEWPLWTSEILLSP